MDRVIKAIALVVAIVIGIVVLLVGSSLGWKAYQARRPTDMPPTSIWIDAPAVPFGFYRGWWLGCWVDSAQPSNRCRLYGPGLEQAVVYEGEYIACEGKSPVPVSDLKLRPPRDSFDMWTRDSKSEMAPAVQLQNGVILVPVGTIQQCEKLRARLNHY
jgi:hypothetical protein